MRLRKYTVLAMKRNINASPHVICDRDSCPVAEVVRVTTGFSFRRDVGYPHKGTIFPLSCKVACCLCKNSAMTNMIYEVGHKSNASWQQMLVRSEVET